jgi:hypothetical protein
MCLINNSFKFIFVHSPKCAGTSVTVYYSPLTSYSDLELGCTEFGESVAPAYKKRFGLAKHSTYSEVAAVVGSVVARQYFTFSFVRNPYLRAASTYHFLKRWTAWPGSAVMERFASFEDYVTSDFFMQDGPDRINRPQLFWLREGLESSNVGVKYVGKIETVEADLDTINRLIPVPLWFKEAAVLQRTNVGTAKFTKNIFTEKAVEAVIKRYRVDFETFGYPTDPPVLEK